LLTDLSNQIGIIRKLWRDIAWLHAFV